MSRAIPQVRRPGIQRLFRGLAWCLLAAVAVVTLAPIGLRPVSCLPVGIERAGAYALASAAFVAGYPRRWPYVIAGLLLAAGLLEAGQTLSATRHGHLADVLQKAFGIVAGLPVGHGLAGLSRGRTADQPPPA